MINTKRIFTALLLAVIAMAGYAYDFEVDGIYYCYNVYGNAVVTHGNKKYTGKIKIPSEVKWNGKKKKVVEIGDYAFECCYELKSVSIPSSVYYIGRFAFSNCRYLESVKIPNTVTSIKHRAFQYCCNLESIIIPSSVNSIGISAFSECKALKDIYCQAVNVPETHSSAFDNSPIENMTLYVPGESINAYKTTDPWSGFGKFQTLTTGIEKTETAAKPMITSADGQISVSGLSGNATIQVLSLDGKLLDSTNAPDGIATLNALPGEVVIVKVGTESYKVVVK
ncbi:leucine-rich repeat domain-containing protein [Prevotella pectinovora]|uniref:leucine-rich repeat domain-containing protein n=1 Tax=Prevotella pectinovora TaxID=1602169 RepID=UPI00307F96BF